MPVLGDSGSAADNRGAPISLADAAVANFAVLSSGPGEPAANGNGHDVSADQAVDVMPAFPAYLVSDALPLSAFGLGPPPPELSPASLWPSPIAAAASAAQLTATALAVPPPPSTEPEPAGTYAALSDRRDDDNRFTSYPFSSEETNSTSGFGSRRASADSVYGVTRNGDLGSQQDGHEAIAEPAIAAHDRPPDAAVPSLQAALAAQTAATIEPALATLDLSRRPAEAPLELPEVPAAEVELPAATSPIAAPTSDGEPTWAPADQPRAQYQDPPLVAPAPVTPPSLPVGPVAALEPNESWPGFLTGFVVAVAIGIGLYVALVGV